MVFFQVGLSDPLLNSGAEMGILPEEVQGSVLHEFLGVVPELWAI